MYRAELGVPRQDAAWFAYQRARPGARVRLFCLPPAGAGASFFRSWIPAAPPGVEVWPVQPPGRETRFREAPLDSVALLVRQLADVLDTPHDLPFALFGHSMGALVAFEVARALRDRSVLPVLLAVSGHRAPHLPRLTPTMHRLPTARLLRQLRRLNGTDPAAFENPELLSLMLPTIRADLALCEHYTHVPAAALPVPIVGFAGTRDEYATPAQMRPWERHTSASFRLRTFPGDHFFLSSGRPAVLSALAEDLLLAAGNGQGRARP